MFGMKVTIHSWPFEGEASPEAVLATILAEGPREEKEVEFTSTAPKGTAKAAAVDRH